VLQPERAAAPAVDPVNADEMIKARGDADEVIMAAAVRPYWTGFLKLSLVTIAVRLYAAATQKDRVHFHLIHEPSGERVHNQIVVPGIGPVDRADIVKGYEYQKGRYVTVAPEDLDRLRLATTDTIDVGQFVEADGLDPVYIADPYYLEPDGSMAEDGYRVFREALRRTGKVALGQVVINTRERVVAIRPYDGGLVVNALRFADEVRSADAFFSGLADQPVDADGLALMEQIITRRTCPFEPEKVVDHYQAALKQMISDKLGGKAPEPAAERPAAQVINLIDALKRSLAEESAARGDAGERRGGKGGKAPQQATRARKTSRAQQNLLLPVKGGRAKAASEEGPSETAAAPVQAGVTRRKRA
jgi:DNA end-binding protein Ku